MTAPLNVNTIQYKIQYNTIRYLMFIILTIYDAFHILWVGVHENESARKLAKFKVCENKSTQKFRAARVRKNKYA